MEPHVFSRTGIKTITGATSVAYSVSYAPMLEIRLLSVSIVNVTRPMADPRACFAAINSERLGSNQGRVVAMGTCSDKNDFVFKFSPPINVKPGNFIQLVCYGEVGDEIYFGIGATQDLPVVHAVSI